MNWHWLFHDWDKWVEVERGNIEIISKRYPERAPRKVGTYLRQERTCITCGEKELNHIQREII